MRQDARHVLVEKRTQCASREARHQFLKLGLQGEEASTTQRSCLWPAVFTGEGLGVVGMSAGLGDD